MQRAPRASAASGSPGGPDAAAAVGLPHLLVAAAVVPLAVGTVVGAWRRLTNV